MYHPPDYDCTTLPSVDAVSKRLFLSSEQASIVFLKDDAGNPLRKLRAYRAQEQSRTHTRRDFSIALVGLYMLVVIVVLGYGIFLLAVR